MVNCIIGQMIRGQPQNDDPYCGVMTTLYDYAHSFLHSVLTSLLTYLLTYILLVITGAV